MPGPRQREPRDPSGTQAILDLIPTQVSFDKEAFMQGILAHGIKVTHYRAIIDPLGMASKGDTHAVLAQRRSSDGFIYVEAGETTALFTSNSLSKSEQPEGNINFASAYITLPEKYDNGEDILVSPWDRFYIKDIEARVIDNQIVEASATGLDRLRYPATCIEHIVDAAGITYKKDVDYALTKEGNVQWLGQHRPGHSHQTGRGVIYSIRYRYTPFFVAARLIHEIRIAAITNEWTGDRSVERMPYQILVVRENVYRDVNNDKDIERNLIDDSRFENVPGSGGNLGPR